MLFDKIKKDRIEAMKNKEATKKDLLTLLVGKLDLDMKMGEDGKKILPSDSEVMAMVKSLIKGQKDLQEKAASNANAVAQAQIEIDILEAYLPKQLTREGIKTAVNAAYNLGNEDMGSIMKFLKAEYEGRYDGKLASEVVKEYLNAVA